MADDKTPQQKANTKQDAARKGTPTFAAVRFKDGKALNAINETIALHGGTKEAALIDAFAALEIALTNEA